MKLENQFRENGFAIVPQFLPAEQAKTLKNIAADDMVMADNSYEKLDAAGRKSKVTLWYEPGEDVFGRLSCSDRLTSEMSAFLGGDAYFFHAKLMQKEPQAGGAWEWHQDYGYWYDDGFLKDDMASCYVALDPAVKQNGCLMVIPGSHHYGRLRHGNVGEQVGAEISRVDVLKDKLGVVYCELEPGDAVYFHSNLLHSSNPNLSDKSRWGLISSFFRSDNESCINDSRFRRKSIAKITHASILDGARSSEKGKSFLRVNG